MDNTITLCGNVTNDPTLRYTSGGAPVVSFDIAVNQRWKDAATQEQREKAMFISVQAWRGLAENAAQSVRKGQRVVIQGRLDLNQWEADDGTARSKHRVIASDIASSMMFGTTEFTRVDRRAAAQIAANTEEPQGEAPPDAQQTPGAQGGEEPF